MLSNKRFSCKSIPFWYVFPARWARPSFTEVRAFWPYFECTACSNDDASREKSRPVNEDGQSVSVATDKGQHRIEDDILLENREKINGMEGEKPKEREMELLFQSTLCAAIGARYSDGPFGGCDGDRSLAAVT